MCGSQSSRHYIARCRHSHFAIVLSAKELACTHICVYVCVQCREVPTNSAYQCVATAAGRVGTVAALLALMHANMQILFSVKCVSTTGKYINKK